MRKTDRNRLNKNYAADKFKREQDKRMKTRVRTQRHNTTPENTRTDTEPRPLTDKPSEY